MTQQITRQDSVPPRPAGAVLANNGAAARQVSPVPLGSIKKSELPAKAAPMAPVVNGAHALDRFLDVPVTMVFEVGRTQISIGKLMELNRGSMIDLWPMSVDVIDILVNDKVIAYGEVIALSQHYGIRFGELKLLDGYEDDNDAV